MAQHKWHKEIKAWADGAEIEIRFYDEQSYEYSSWVLDKTFNWDILNAEYRIKPQPFAKCIVKDCMNHTNEGSFVGELCAPCWDYITNGNGVHSQAYRNAQPKDEKPKYLYVYKMMTNHGLEIQLWDSKTYTDERYLGRTKLEIE